MLRWLIGIILGKIICESSNWQHIQILKITILGANWQLFRLERIAKCSYFMLSTQNITLYRFVTKLKKYLLPIWWYNRGLFPLGNKYFEVFVLNGLRKVEPVEMIDFAWFFCLYKTVIGTRSKCSGMQNVMMMIIMHQFALLYHHSALKTIIQIRSNVNFKQRCYDDDYCASVFIIIILSLTRPLTDYWTSQLTH